MSDNDCDAGGSLLYIVKKSSIVELVGFFIFDFQPSVAIQFPPDDGEGVGGLIRRIRRY